ncbi:gas vesicle protein GvpD P-loop domain-containing protein [Candidatus Aciduliprofundum boonei]|uniref:GvpD gas vesicle n=1 Tax=Aciduliprofundum boonei (strain DSM 19572 / T469) TaxID=439481 RepID=B5IAA9_ACIB4|nr:gas vesicle protein GvpD P-loop domain-containing protein [Candidatus Aciduliprofundum boonei]ADD08251.1 GvpD gas vesicle [Aciduliprofundum boonei T469]EDY36877.1 GvpD gas vesicle protein, putative [Aciduliprofundum boonei T469]
MIPQEVIGFFKNKGGHSLIIKGEPGSGKTTFALEILNSLKDHFEIQYLSSRVADDVLFLQFPWLENVLKKKIKKSNSKKIKREELNKLEGLIEEGLMEEKATFTENEAIFEIGSMMPEIDEIYDFVENVHPKKALVCVDSIDGLSEKYGVPAEKLLYTLQKDLVEEGVANIVFVLESSGFENIEYLGDGVISLHHEPWNSSWKRYMYIKKLRGSPIKRSKYIYTLEGGHFNVLNYNNFSLDNIKSIDLSNLISYLESIDSSSLNLIISPNFPVELLQAIVLSFLKMSKEDSLIIPPISYPSTKVKEHSSKFLDKDVKTAGFNKEKADIILEGSDMLIELSPDIVNYHIKEGANVIISLDTLLGLYGDLRDLPRLIERMKRSHRVILLSWNNEINAGIERTINMVMMENIPVINDSKSAKAIIPKMSNDGISLELIPLM